MKKLKAIGAGSLMAFMLAGCATTAVNYGPPITVQPKPGMPIKSKPQVLSIWMSPYIDNADNYHSGSYVYTVYRPSGWVAGHNVIVVRPSSLSSSSALNSTPTLSEIASVPTMAQSSPLTTMATAAATPSPATPTLAKSALTQPTPPKTTLAKLTLAQSATAGQ